MTQEEYAELKVGDILVYEDYHMFPEIVLEVLDNGDVQVCEYPTEDEIKVCMITKASLLSSYSKSSRDTNTFPIGRLNCRLKEIVEILTGVIMS